MKIFRLLFVMSLFVPTLAGAESYQARTKKMWTFIEKHKLFVDLPLAGGYTDERVVNEVRVLILMSMARHHETLSEKEMQKVLKLKVSLSTKTLVDIRTGNVVLALNRLPDVNNPMGEIVLSQEGWAKAPIEQRMAILHHEFLGLQNRDRLYEETSLSPDFLEIWNSMHAAQYRQDGTSKLILRAGCYRPAIEALVKAVALEINRRLGHKMQRSGIGHILEKVNVNQIGTKPGRKVENYRYVVEERQFTEFENLEQLYTSLKVPLSFQVETVKLRLSGREAAELVKKTFKVVSDPPPGCRWKISGL